MRIFWKIWKNENFQEQMEKYENFQFSKERDKKKRDDEALYESPCGNLVDGLPHDCHKTEPHRIGWAGHPRTSMNFVVEFVFLVNFCIMVTSFVLLTLNISYWSFIFCEYQLPSSIKPLLTTGVWVFQKWWKMMIFFKKIRKISGNSFSFRNSKLNTSTWRNIDDGM